jgi:hypothetical protein
MPKDNPAAYLPKKRGSKRKGDKNPFAAVAHIAKMQRKK